MASRTLKVTVDCKDVVTALTRLRDDVKFLATRNSYHNDVGRWSAIDQRRFTGISSDSIVAILYKAQETNKQYMPSDPSDYMACWRTVNMLPPHRKAQGRRLLAKAFKSLRKEYQRTVKAHLKVTNNEETIA